MAGLGTCCRVWGHVAGGGGMWQGVGSYGRGHKDYGYMVGGRVGTCGRGWGRVAGCGGMWQWVVACGRVWAHVGRGWEHVAWG